MSYTYLHTLPRHYALPIRSDILDPGDFLGETDAARALDAARHHRFDDRPHIFLGDGALVFLITRRAAAIGDRLVLQVALAALVADRAIERMIDEQELDRKSTRLEPQSLMRISSAVFCLKKKNTE